MNYLTRINCRNCTTLHHVYSPQYSRNCSDGPVPKLRVFHPTGTCWRKQIPRLHTLSLPEPKQSTLRKSVSEDIEDASIKLRVEDAPLDISDLPVGKTKTVALKIHSPSKQKIRIVGFGGSCGPLGCTEAFTPETLAIAPGQSQTVEILFKSAAAPGPILCEFTMHYASDTVSSQKFQITGNAIEEKQD
ncbi:MAG: hypothetical protein AAF483_03840 [Planctomycetota bacterium]